MAHAQERRLASRGQATRSVTRLAVLAVAGLVAACGGDGGSGPTTDDPVVRSTPGAPGAPAYR